MTGSARTRGFDGPPAEINATTIRNPRGVSDGIRTYLLSQPHDSKGNSIYAESGEILIRSQIVSASLRKSL